MAAEHILFSRHQRIVANLESEISQLRSVIDSLPGSVYWKSPDGQYLGRNNAESKVPVFGGYANSNNDEIIGKTDFDFFPKSVAQVFQAQDKQVMNDQKEHVLEEPIVLPNGKKVIQLAIKRPLYDQNGEVCGIVGTTIDITSLKEIQIGLEQAKEAAQRVAKTQADFIRNMEHDIRTPFTGILGLAERLYNIETDQYKKEYLGDICICAKELLAYCNSILDFARVQSGAFKVQEKKFKVTTIITRILNLETLAAKAKGITLGVEIDPRVPAVVVGDCYRLHRILINLLSNAIKFTHQGAVNIKVTLVTMIDRSIVLRFIIEDTGQGIPGDQQEYIFERFVKLELSSSGYRKGLGLGLSIVKQFMNDVHGEIDLVSKPGGGTNFMCTIPFKKPLSDDYVDDSLLHVENSTPSAQYI